MVLYRLKNFIYAALATVFALFAAMGVKLTNVSRLSALQGERTFFLESASSQGLMKTELALSELGKVKGESVSFSINDYEGGRDALSAEIAQKFGAKILFTEEVVGVISYYCYTPRWENGLLLGEEFVNLHVAISNERCVVGTPIIFGGF